MSVLEEAYLRQVRVAEAQRDEVKDALDKALEMLAGAAALAKTELDPTEHTRIVTAADTARVREQAAVEVARIRHATIRFVATAVLLGWLAAVVGGAL